MVTTPRTTIVHRVLALAVACVVALLAPAAAGTERARAADGPACAPAALLVSQGLPRRALALLTAPGAASCPDAAAGASTRIHQSLVYAESAAVHAKAGEWQDAAGNATAALREDLDNTSADVLRVEASVEVARAKAKVAAAAEAKKSWLEKLEDQWNGFFDQQLSPVGALLLPFVGVLFGLVLLARLVVLAARRWPDADDLPTDRIRPSMLVGGVLSVGAASLLASLVAADSASNPLSGTLTWTTLATTLLAAGCGIFTAVRQRRRERSQEAQRSGPWAPRTRHVIALLSIAAAALAVIGMATRLLRGDEVADPVEPLTVLALAALLAVQGVWLLAWWLATRTRLDIKGPTGAADIGTVVALLSELGAEKPSGLEVPRGADVTALDGALGSLPDNPVLKVLKDIIRSISGVTPWTATIEGDATTRVVTVVRNGRTLGSAIIDPQRLGLVPDDSTDADTTPGANASTTTTKAADDDKTTTPDATLQMAAAFVLTTMAQCHPAIRRGLAGTTSWKSLGYQYVGASMQPGESDKAQRDRQRALLACALDEDAENRAARLAFRHAIDRDAKDCQGLSRYAKFLEAFAAELVAPGHDFEAAALRLRAVYTRALILVNAVFAHAAGEHGDGAGTCAFDSDDMMRQARASLSLLRGLAATPPDDTGQDPLREFKKQFNEDVQGVRFLVGLERAEPVPSSPVGMYNLGCTFASRHDVLWRPASLPATLTDDETAREWLDRACHDPGTREWMTTDPQLTGFRGRQTYRRTYLPAPRTDFFSLSTVKPFAARLKSAGYGDVTLLEDADPMALAPAVSADPGVCAQLVELARLHRGLASFGASPQEQPFDRLIRAFEEGLPPGESGLQRLLREFAEGVRADMGPGSAIKEAKQAPLDRWAIELLDELSSRGLARRSSLLALSGSRRTSLAEKITATLMKRHQPGEPSETGDLTDYEKGLSATISVWFRRPYQP